MNASHLMRVGLDHERIEALHCFSMWTNYGIPMFGSEDNIKHLSALVTPMMQCLLDDDTEQDALNVFTDLLEGYTNFFDATQLQAFAAVIQNHFIPTTTSYACQFLVAYGNAVIQDVVEQGSIVLAPLGTILQSPGTPCDDDELTPITIEFWNTYVEYLTDASNGEESWLPNAVAVMTELGSLLYRKLFIPAQLENKDNFKAFRTDVADLLSSMYIILNKDLLIQFVDLTLNAIGKDWQAVEAGVFCLNALSDNCLEYESNDQYITPLFDRLFTTEPTRSLIDMIGEYGQLLKRRPEYIPNAVRYLFSALNTPLANIAAKSIYELCSTCRSRLTGDLEAFIAQYNTLMDPYIKEKVIGGIAAIIQALPDADKVQPLLALIQSIEGQGLTTLQCLTSMGKASQEPEDIDAPENNFWSGPGKIVQDRIINCFVLDGTGESVDTACQVLRTGYTELAGPFVFPPSVTVDFLKQCTIETPQVESVLSATALLITQHSRQRTRRIDSEAQAILEHVIMFLQALRHPSEDPSIANNCLEIVSRLTKSYLPVLLANSQMPLILDFAIQAIEGQDIMPKRSSLDLWTKLLKEKDAEEIMNGYGLALTQVLVRQVAGIGQRSDLDTVNQPLKELFISRPAQAKQWLEASLWSEAFPPVNGTVGDAEKRRFLSQLVSLRGGAKTKDVVRDFYSACRGVVSSYN